MILSSQIRQDEFAELVGVSEGRVSQQVADGTLVRGKTAGEWLLAYCDRLRGQAADRVGDEVGGLDLPQERAALAREQRIRQSLVNDQLRVEYAQVRVLERTLANIRRAIGVHLEQLPARLHGQCPWLSPHQRAQVGTVIASARNEWLRSTAELGSMPAMECHIDVESIDGEDDEGHRP